MPRTVLALSLLCLPACDGEGPITEVPAPECRGLVTTVVGSLPYYDIPAGTRTAHDTFAVLPGRYEASDSCKKGGLTTVKLTGAVPWESLPIVTTAYGESPCGCVEDEENYSSDTDYTHVAQIPGSTMFVEDGFEAGAQNTTVFTETALFDGSAPFLVRSCGSVAIEPYRESAYQELLTVARVDQGGVISGHYTLVSDDESVACALTNFTLVGVE